MLPDRPKSWLLGSGYRWRTYAKESVDEDAKNGLSLSEVGTIDTQVLEATPLPHQFVLDRFSYDIDREQREVRAYTFDDKLRHRWGARDAEGNYVPKTDPAAWDPIDIVGDSSCVFLLDQRYQAIYTHAFGRESLSLLFQSQDKDSRWFRIALDQHGCLLIFDALKKEANCYGRSGNFLGTTPGPWPEPRSSELSPPTRKPVPSVGPSYRTEGYWLSQPIDSGIYNCQWHRFEMTLKNFPPGTQIEVKAFAYADKEQAPLNARDPRLVTCYAVAALMQPPPDAVTQERARRLSNICESPQNKIEKKSRVDEFLNQSGPGQFLSVFVSLRGDSFGTPVIEGLRVHYPRQSYLEYLPPLYSANEPMRVFLDAFLSIFQTEWDEFDRRVDESDAFLDPDAVPEGVAMKYLASWMGLELEGSWSGEQNRRLLQAIPKIYPRRGTAAALRDYLRVYLANIAELAPEVVSMTGYPAIIEGFQERQHLLLSQPAGGTLGQSQPLWSDAMMRRLQLGGFAREGEVELVSTGDPEHDFFNYFAHRFRVYVPAVWVRTAEKERLFRRAIEAEMPAHVKYDLCLVEAGLRVDIQSTVGIDTIIGEPAPWQLPCDPETQAPSLATLNRLGQGTILSKQPGSQQAVLGARARVGDWILD